MIHVEAGAIGGVPRSRHDDRAYLAEGDSITIHDRFVRITGLGCGALATISAPVALASSMWPATKSACEWVR